MDLGLKGKKVILTGGSRGIGRAALDIFAAEGCDVAFFSRGQKQVDETIAALKKHGHKVYGSTFDLNNLASGYAAWLTRAAEQLGGCDIFVPGASASGSQAIGRNVSTSIFSEPYGAARRSRAPSKNRARGRSS